MADIDPIYMRMDELISLSRLQELALIVNSDRAERIARMMLVLSALQPGAYLLGTGPSTVGIIPLTVDEVVLGRVATPMEQPSETVVDYAVADTLYFGPCEVSRVHAKLVRRTAHHGICYVVADLGSSRGTFVNGQPVAAHGEGTAIRHGDVLSLGPSQINTYVFYQRPPTGVLAPEKLNCSKRSE